MATDQRTCPAAIQSDADMRLWVQAFEGALLATGGLVVDSGVTGQIDPTTVARPATSTDAGYRIYRFNDAMHTGGTRPIWLKILYGIASGATTPRLTCQFGEASPTAGTFAGSRVISSGTFQPGAPTAGNTRTIWASGGDGRVNIVASDLSASSQTILLGLERVKDLTGANVDDGVVMVSGAGSAVWGMLTHSRYGQSSFVVDSSGAGPGVIGYQNQHGVAQYGGDLLLSPPMFPIAPNFRVLAGFLHALATGVLAAGSTVSFSHLGASHTWMPLSTNQAQSSWIKSSPVGQVVMLWE